MISPAAIGDERLLQARMGLTLGSPNEALRASIQGSNLPPAALAGLWLLHDFVEEAHAICQNLSTPDGSYWHGILHRREGDYSNAKYWFRQAGQHPVIRKLQENAADLGYSYSTPQAFVDFCEAARGSESELLAINVQMLEWRLLFEICMSDK